MLIYLCSCRKCKINQCRLSHNSTQLNSASGAFKKTGFSLKKPSFFTKVLKGFSMENHARICLEGCIEVSKQSVKNLPRLAIPKKLICIFIYLDVAFTLPF